MKCKKCNSENVKIDTSVVMKSKSRSFLWNLFMCIITAGLWLIWMLIRKKKEKQVIVKMATCQSCGYSWEM